jgi:hypothetical protein
MTECTNGSESENRIVNRSANKNSMAESHTFSVKDAACGPIFSRLTAHILGLRRSHCWSTKFSSMTIMVEGCSDPNEFCNQRPHVHLLGLSQLALVTIQVSEIVDGQVLPGVTQARSGKAVAGVGLLK